MKQLDEGVCDRRLVFAGVEFVRECVEGKWIVSEVGDVKDCFSIW
jgi:hypothetical protein